jgi:hypothetical protein
MIENTLSVLTVCSQRLVRAAQPCVALAFRSFRLPSFIPSSPPIMADPGEEITETP